MFIAEKLQNTAILQPQKFSQIIVQSCDVVGAGIPMNVLLFENTIVNSPAVSTAVQIKLLDVRKI